MTRPSKRKTKVKERERDSDGTFAKKPRFIDNWGDEDDSGWDEDDLSNEKENKSELVWTDSAYLEQKKRGPYLTGKTKKSTFFDKYGPSGSFTKAAKGSANILTLLNKYQSIPDDFDEILEDMENEEQNNKVNIKERLEHLKIELKEKQKSLTVIEYNKKRAIFEYLKRLDDNGKGKVKASIEAAQLVFIESAPYKARSIRYWASYWLQYNHLPISRQGKHQKTLRLIDDEDIAEKCHTWIRSQGGKITPIKFKEFVEQKLLINTGIMKKKTISTATASRWLNVLGYFFQSHKQGKIN
jgi:hypothetical protein